MILAHVGADPGCWAMSGLNEGPESHVRIAMSDGLRAPRGADLLRSQICAMSHQNW